MSVLPWSCGSKPLMLAPMQGLTNAALRACYLEHYQPDVVFTEFVRVQAQSRKRIARSDLAELEAHVAATPLVVQLIGHNAEALAAAAEVVQQSGCDHLNFNLGCPYGRMTTGATGGELLRETGKLFPLLQQLRQACRGSFSLKSRAGYSDPQQIFELLPLYQEAGIDYLILHPRTVEQRYAGQADHQLTLALAEQATIPLIANGDINDVETGRTLLAAPQIAGLMLGRGALNDPLLFQRLRGKPVSGSRRQQVGQLICRLLPGYQQQFCGERQMLMKIKDVLNFIFDSELQRDLGKLKRATSLSRFELLVEKLFLFKE